MDEGVTFQSQVPKDNNPEENKTSDMPTSISENTPNDASEPDSGTTDGRVFDITPDLNISQLKDDVSEKNEPVSKTDIPIKPIPTINTQAFVPPSKPLATSAQNTTIPAQSQTPVQTAVNGLMDTPTNQTPTKTVVSTDPNIKQLRTYESDFAEAVSHNKISTASIAIAENKRKEALGENTDAVSTKNKHSIKNSLILLTSLILFTGGIIAAYYLYSISPLAPAPSVQQPIKSSSLIPSDSRINIAIDNLFPAAIMSLIKKEITKPQNNNSIKEIVFTKIDKENVVNITAQQMIDIFDIEAPDILLRSLDKPWMLGIYSDQNGQKNIFVAVKNNLFQNAFAGMLQWESVMAEDFRQYLNIPTYVEPIIPIKVNTQATSTQASTTNQASTTEVFEPKYFSLRGQFTDRLIKNKDVREFITTDGNVLFLYSFIDNNTIIVTGNEATVSEIITRLEKQSFLR